MPFEIREESLETARADAIAVLEATREHAVDDSRFQWLYCDNPDGPAVLWAIRETETGEMAGFTVALPRRMLVDGVQRMAWNGADFSILPRFRTLGLALKLRRAAKEGVDAGRVDFLYAHPNERMAVIHAKVGHQPVGNMVRYAKVLKTAPYLEQRVRNRALTAVGAALADPLLRFAGAETRHRAKCDTHLLESGQFDQRFDDLFESAAPTEGVIGVRDCKYLNWRYSANPLAEYQVLVAETEGELCGYAVLSSDGITASMKDIFPMDNRQVARDLLSEIVRHARRSGLNSVSFTLLAENPLVSILSEFGFRIRSETSQMFSYAAESCDFTNGGPPAGPWWITVGDRDV